METFTFCPRVNPEGEFTQRTRAVQFGDGYTQRSGDGINSESQSWPLTFVGDNTFIQEIMAFLRRHNGYTAFQWVSPLSELGLYCCPDGFNVTALGKNSRGVQMFQLTATFITAYHP
ncbi:phage-related protein|uniref:Phage-related protein n=1 Tax=Brenneria salicis ATCC 15712 = DSM 30166 TaxID=714314 RepID=A0A366IBL8_9GAMM|nr:phage tail protein [Brenneria salicis]NMN90982.1 phage-related protein [Brenneria salicis ATCC 15712 = DSM 30166]RBP66474.1 phage-related protein [Brenneria salicis ATCC 15712 = DSM 30166]RLM32067.1 phage tail protein [Brenneria salicis ATCC 15712 = DSM 30166]